MKKEERKMNREQWTSFGLGVLAGAVAGGVVALLYAPKSGRELREDIRGKTGEVLETGKAKIGEIRHRMGEKISGEECVKPAATPRNGD
jgi:gas vesicle protein